MNDFYFYQHNNETYKLNHEMIAIYVKTLSGCVVDTCFIICHYSFKTLASG